MSVVATPSEAPRSEANAVRRATLALVVAAAALVVAACDEAIVLSNARPRVTWVAVEALAPGDAACAVARCARVTLWVADVEGDAVDVTATWSAGSDGGDVVLAPGSYPLVGLPTITAVNDVQGEPHQFLWDLDAVPSGDVVLSFTADDRPYDSASGDVYVTPALDPRTDVSPVAVTLAP